MPATVWAYMYGNQTGGKVYGIIATFLSCSVIIVFILQRIVYPRIGYENIFCIVSGLSLISLILLLFFKEKEFVVEDNQSKQSDQEYSRLNQSF